MPAIIWHQEKVAPFDEAEFYERGPVVTIIAEDEFAITVSNDGDRDLEEQLDADGNNYRCIRTAAEFRERFPDGSTPSDDEDKWTWINNGWFDLYGPDGYHIDSVEYSLGQALADADAMLIDREARKADAKLIRERNADEPDTWPSQNWIDYGEGGHG